ncbi:CPCC family cysteine-rich protein [Burkholderia sp. MSMB1835]|uniref:CPCC family cysteine-rich protein n=1 Tax=Burkholderia sp. MSMB1835 TaxID=1637876 RepID=UPI0009E73DEE
MASRYACPCCGYLTYLSPPSGTFEICPVCMWEDDNVQLDDPDYSGGANVVSLNQARQNFNLYGASEARFEKSVRRPNPEEIP